MTFSQTFTPAAGTQGGCWRGIGADTMGNVWAASNSQCGVSQIDRETATQIQFHTLNPCSTPVGVSVDIEGYVWIVDQGQGAWKIDPADPNNKQFLPIANNHYTYSDMTGGQVANIIIQ